MPLGQDQELRRTPLDCVAAGLAGGIVMSLAHPPAGWWIAAPGGGTALCWVAMRAPSAGAAALGGLAFGIGVHGPVLGWLYSGVSPEEAPVFAYGAPSVLIAFFAIAPTITAWAVRRSQPSPTVGSVFVVAALWTVFEWLRQFGAFRFPWAHLGYTQVGGPLAGLFPLVGVLGLSFVTMILGGLTALCLVGRTSRDRLRLLAGIGAILLAANTGARVEWTRPSGVPITVASMQGAFPIAEKFRPDGIEEALKTYADFALRSRAQVTILPETALPLLDRELPAGYLPLLEAAALSEVRDLLVSFLRDADNAGKPGSNQGSASPHHNSARVLGMSGNQNYDKRILLPFGEYVPASRLLRPLFERIASIPMLETVPGMPNQPQLVLGGQRIALRLCFEDLFGSHWRDEIAQAAYLVVLANDSWEGSDRPMHQHLQVAQARALESGKPLVRVANTGWSGLIGADGRLMVAAPPNRQAILDFELQARTGLTPYVRFGDALPVGIALLAAASTLLRWRLVQHSTPAAQAKP